jgi:hypothetical protein
VRDAPIESQRFANAELPGSEPRFGASGKTRLAIRRLEARADLWHKPIALQQEPMAPE